MPKLSISVPDDLWDEARAGATTTGASQLVQEALRRLVADRRLPYSGPSPGSEERLGQVRTKKRAEVDELFAEGYEEGLGAAEDYPWEFIDWAASLDFDPVRMRAENEKFSLGWVLDEILPNLSLRGRVFDEGIRRALRDAWQAVLADETKGEPK